MTDLLSFATALEKTLTPGTMEGFGTDSKMLACEVPAKTVYSTVCPNERLPG